MLTSSLIKFHSPGIAEIMFHLASGLAAGAPLVLFWGGGPNATAAWHAVFEGQVRESLLFYLIFVVVSALLLSHSYIRLASKTRRQLLLSR